MSQDIENLIAEASQSSQTSQSTEKSNISSEKKWKQQAKKFSCSKWGLCLIAFLIVFFLLVALQPKYVVHYPDEEHEKKKLNWWAISLFSIGSALLVFFVPWGINRRKLKQAAVADTGVP